MSPVSIGVITLTVLLLFFFGLQIGGGIRENSETIEIAEESLIISNLNKTVSKLQAENEDLKSEIISLEKFIKEDKIGTNKLREVIKSLEANLAEKIAKIADLEAKAECPKCEKCQECPKCEVCGCKILKNLKSIRFLRVFLLSMINIPIGNFGYGSSTNALKFRKFSIIFGLCFVCSQKKNNIYNPYEECLSCAQISNSTESPKCPECPKCQDIDENRNCTNSTDQEVDELERMKEKAEEYLGTNWDFKFIKNQDWLDLPGMFMKFRKVEL